MEVKGVAASPRRKAELSLRGKKCQGWKPYRQATHSPHPPEVPCLDLGRLRDSDEEDGDSYILHTGRSHRCQLDSSSEWRTSLQTPYAQHQHKTRPENLPSPTDRSKQKQGHYEAGTKEECKQHPQRIAEMKKDHLQWADTSIKGTQFEGGHDDFVALDKKALLQQCYTNKAYNMQHNIRKSEAEDVAAERRKQAIVEQVMVDQLCRVVLSDPEQSTRSDACKEGQGLLGAGIASMHFRKRTLHETKIRTKSGLTENMLSNKLRFDSRVISRTNGLPFIQKGVYQHQRGQRKGKAYDLSDFYIGFFCGTQGRVFEASSCRQQSSQEHSRDKGTWMHGFVFLTSTILCRHGVLYFYIVSMASGQLEAALKEAPKVFHLEMPEGVNLAETVNAYMKLDFNKTGNVPMVDVRKCYCAKKHPLVLAGKTAEEEIKSSFLGALGESCSNCSETSYSEFEDYYEGLNFGIMDDDDFVNILRNSWGI